MMLTLGRVVFIMIVSMSLGYAGSVVATVDNQEVVQGNVVTLSIKATGGSAVFPTIDKIGKLFVQNAGTSSSRNVSIINGSIKNEVSTTKSYRLTPTENMTIPAYEVTIEGKVYTTQAITLKMVKSNAGKSQGNQRFSLRLESTHKQVNVGESFMVTAYFALHKNVQVAQEVQYNPPSLADFSVAEIAQKPAYMKGQYQVQEIQYIATPQQEGNFTIDPAQVKVAISDNRRRGFFAMMGGKWYQTLSNALNIEVLPQAEESDVIGEFTLTSTVDSQEVKANKPVNLTIKIEGNGNLQGFEIPQYEIDGVTVYRDEAKVDSKVVDGKIYSIFTQSFALISSEDFRIPSHDFTAYSPKEKKLKTLSVKSFDIKVKKSAYQKAMTATPKGVVQSQNTQHIGKAKEVIVEKIIEVETIKWWMLLLAFILGMLLMYLGRFMPTKISKSYSEEESLKLLYGQMNAGADIEEMVRKLYAKKRGDKTVEIDKKVLREMVGRFS